ncbi:DUF6907 domain-containing protein [Actinacidiphila alni]|uniref:DUF6907 domain-containing protein n=1 Tax=Actinacidiphila alni TaxID=380248 RepID=UPI00345675E5
MTIVEPTASMAPPTQDQRPHSATPDETATRTAEWTVTAENGTTVTGHLPAWAEKDPSESGVPADLLETTLSDVGLYRYYPGQTATLDTTVYATADGSRYNGPAPILRPQIVCRPHDDDPAERVPLVQLEVVEGGDDWIPNLDPAGVISLADGLCEHAGRLYGVAADLADARADWLHHHPDAPIPKVEVVQRHDGSSGSVAVATSVVMRAVTSSLAGLTTNPTDVAKQLHRSIDNAQGWHLAEVGAHSEAQAYASSRFTTAVDAMADALGAAEDRSQMARALTTALGMVLGEKGLDTAEGATAVYVPPIAADGEPAKTTVQVRSMRLDDAVPVALRDTTKKFDLAIDFSHPPTNIAAALQVLFEEAIETQRWTRRQPTAGDRAPYVPPTDWDAAEKVTAPGAKGSIVRACLYTPEWHGIPEGPTRLCVYGEPAEDAELDLDGANRFIADLEALLPKLRVMRDILAEQATA